MFTPALAGALRSSNRAESSMQLSDTSLPNNNLAVSINSLQKSEATARDQDRGVGNASNF